MNSQLKLLMALQAFDSDIDRLSAEVDAKEETIRAAEEALEQAKQGLDEAKKAHQKSVTDQKQMEIDLASRDDAIRKHHAELNKVKSNDAYKALLNEIEQATRSKNSLEENILVQMERCDDLVHAFKKQDADLKQTQAKTAAEVGKLRGEIDAAKARLESMQQDRKKRADEISLKAMSKYDRVRRITGGEAIAQVSKQNCGGCGSRLPESIVDSVRKGLDLVACLHCSRMLYIPEPPTSPPPSKPTN